MAKCMQKCSGKYIKSTSPEDASVQNDVFIPKVTEFSVTGRDQVRSMRGI